MHCRKFSCIPGLYPLETHPPLLCDKTKASPDTAKCPLGAKLPQVENHRSGDSTEATV